MKYLFRRRAMAFTDILGSLMSGGLGGRSDTGPNFLQNLEGQARQDQGQPAQRQDDSSGFMGTGMGLGQLASIAGVAAIGYKAWTSHQQKEQEREQWAAQGGQPQQSGGAWFGGSQQQHAPSDSTSLLLIKTMIAAAAADNEITQDERGNLMRQVERANASQNERAQVEGLLNNPPYIDDVLAQVRDQNTAEQVYYAACIGMQGNSPSAAPFLDYVGNKLNLPQDRRQAIQSVLYQS